MDFYAENGVFSPIKILEAENGLQKSVGVYPNVFIQERGLINHLIYRVLFFIVCRAVISFRSFKFNNNKGVVRSIIVHKSKTMIENEYIWTIRTIHAIKHLYIS